MLSTALSAILLVAIVLAAISADTIVPFTIFAEVIALSAICKVVTALVAISLDPTAFSEIIEEVTALLAGKVSTGRLPIYAIMIAP